MQAGLQRNLQGCAENGRISATQWKFSVRPRKKRHFLLQTLIPKAMDWNQNVCTLRKKIFSSCGSPGATCIRMCRAKSPAAQLYKEIPSKCPRKSSSAKKSSRKTVYKPLPTVSLPPRIFLDDDGSTISSATRTNSNSLAALISLTVIPIQGSHLSALCRHLKPQSHGHLLQSHLRQRLQRHLRQRLHHTRDLWRPTVLRQFC